MLNKISIVILISGNGSNLQAIINAIQSNMLPINIQAVVSDNPLAFGLERAQNAKIPTCIVELKQSMSRESFDHTLTNAIAPYNPDLIVLAGFMRILGSTFLKTFEHKILNIHPSLLPKYPGLRTHQLAIADKISEHGCTVHFVNEQLDAGPIIAQASLKVNPSDTPTTLKEKVHKAEHFLYPTVLNWFAHHRVKLVNNQVYLDAVSMGREGLRFRLNSI